MTPGSHQSQTSRSLMSQAYANGKEIKIVGDMPIYVGGQSADVWAYQDLFELSDTGSPVQVSGVPPDAFSDTGQLWGSPLYDWPVSHVTSASVWPSRMYPMCRPEHSRDRQAGVL